MGNANPSTVASSSVNHSRIRRAAIRVLPRALLTEVRARRQIRMVKRFHPYTVSHSYGGLTLRITIPDPLAQGWYDHPWELLPELDLLRTKGALRPGATVFDLGAHQGVVALMLAAEVGTSGVVVAIEGTRHNVDAARHNAALNGADNVIVEHAAVAAVEGTIHFSSGLNGHVGLADEPSPTELIPAVTVDSLARRYGMPDVIFVDVEGFEQEVLMGAATTLDQGPDWFVEVHTRVGLEDQGGSVSGVLEEFEKRNYRLFISDATGALFQPIRAPLPQERFYLIALAGMEPLTHGSSVTCFSQSRGNT